MPGPGHLGQSGDPDPRGHARHRDRPARPADHQDRAGRDRARRGPGRPRGWHRDGNTQHGHGERPEDDRRPGRGRTCGRGDPAVGDRRRRGRRADPGGRGGRCTQPGRRGADDRAHLDPGVLRTRDTDAPRVTGGDRDAGGRIRDRRDLGRAIDGPRRGRRGPARGAGARRHRAGLGIGPVGDADVRNGAGAARGDRGGRPGAGPRHGVVPSDHREPLVHGRPAGRRRGTGPDLCAERVQRAAVGGRQPGRARYPERGNARWPSST